MGILGWYTPIAIWQDMVGVEDVEDGIATQPIGLLPKRSLHGDAAFPSNWVRDVGLGSRRWEGALLGVHVISEVSDSVLLATFGKHPYALLLWDACFS